MCFTVSMAENGLRLKIAAMTKVAMVETTGHLLTGRGVEDLGPAGCEHFASDATLGGNQDGYRRCASFWANVALPGPSVGRTQLRQKLLTCDDQATRREGAPPSRRCVETTKVYEIPSAANPVPALHVVPMRGASLSLLG